MSRTDKDMPYWVRATWWQPQHYQCDCPDAEHFRGWRYNRPVRPCDLPAEPRIELPRRPARCTWGPVWEWHYWCGRGPDRDFVNLIWHGPQRRQARDDCRRAIAEYRAHGTVQVIPSTDPARNGAKWLW